MLAWPSEASNPEFLRIGEDYQVRHAGAATLKTSLNLDRRPAVKVKNLFIAAVEPLPPRKRTC